VLPTLRVAFSNRKSPEIVALSGAVPKAIVVS
jgi:hypothetical protein